MKDLWPPVDAQLVVHGLARDPVVGDGNCLFHTVLHQWRKEGWAARVMCQDLSTETVPHLEANPRVRAAHESGVAGAPPRLGQVSRQDASAGRVGRRALQHRASRPLRCTGDGVHGPWIAVGVPATRCLWPMLVRRTMTGCMQACVHACAARHT